MADEIGVAGNRVRSFVERVEQLESEIAELNEQKKRSSPRPRAKAST
jgi:uncharacterized protein (UPF0335 family)